MIRYIYSVFNDQIRIVILSSVNPTLLWNGLPCGTCLWPGRNQVTQEVRGG